MVSLMSVPINIHITIKYIQIWIGLILNTNQIAGCLDCLYTNIKKLTVFKNN